jgi:hypothetical protein
MQEDALWDTENLRQYAQNEEQNIPPPSFTTTEVSSTGFRRFAQPLSRCKRKGDIAYYFTGRII